MEETDNHNQPNALQRALKALWRFFSLLLTGIVVGGVIYFGFVQFYLIAVQTTQNSAARISAVETLTSQEQAQASGRMDTLSQRVAALEKQQGQQVQSISDLQGRTSSLERAVADQSAALERVSSLENRVTALSADLDANASQDQILADSLTASDAPLASMQREVQALKAMELVSRARLNLLQNNAGLARQDVESAYTMLAALKDKTPAAQQPVVELWLQRLTLVLGNLPSYPVMAADDLEIAWRQLDDGFTPPAAAVEPTSNPQGVSATPILSPTSTATQPALILTPTP